MFRKRLFVALTVIVMVISMVGVTAFADSDIVSDEVSDPIFNLEAPFASAVPYADSFYSISDLIAIASKLYPEISRTDLENFYNTSRIPEDRGLGDFTYKEYLEGMLSEYPLFITYEGVSYLHLAPVAALLDYISLHFDCEGLSYLLGIDSGSDVPSLTLLTSEQDQNFMYVSFSKIPVSKIAPGSLPMLLKGDDFSNSSVNPGHSNNNHQDLSSIVTPVTMTHVLDEVVGLLPIVLPVLILFIGLRKGISWLMNFLQSA